METTVTNKIEKPSVEFQLVLEPTGKCLFCKKPASSLIYKNQPGNFCSLDHFLKWALDAKL